MAFTVRYFDKTFVEIYSLSNFLSVICQVSGISSLSFLYNNLTLTRTHLVLQCLEGVNIRGFHLCVFKRLYPAHGKSKLNLKLNHSASKLYKENG